MKTFKLMPLLGGLTLTVLTVGCAQQDTANSNTNINSNVAVTNTTTTTTTTTTNTNANTGISMTTTGPDNSEIEKTEAGGVRTETRTFKGENRRIDRVVVTTRDGKRTARVYGRSGEVKDLPENKVERALDSTGDALADAVGFVVDKTKDAASATKEGAEKAIDKTGDAAKTVGKKTAEGTQTVVEKSVETGKTIGEKTADGAKTVGKKTAEGARKVGGAVKDAINP